MEKMNSREYWENRYKTNSWEQFCGKEQSAFFARVAVNSFPEWFASELSQNEWTLRDYGCAQGDGTAYLAQRFPSCSVTGIDFSEEAVKRASEQYPYCEFLSGDVTEHVEEADVVFSSNTLEHLKNPKKHLKELVKSARKYAVILVPLEDNSEIEEHFHVFDTGFFPMRIDEHAMCCMRVTDYRNVESETVYWRGKQILVIYVNTAYKDMTERLLTDFYRANVYPLQEERCVFLEQLAAQKEKLAQAEQEADAVRQSFSNDLEKERENERAVRAEWIKEREIQQQTEQRLMEEKESLQSCRKSLLECEQQLQRSQERLQELEAQLNVGENHIREYQGQLDVYEASIQAYKAQLEERDSSIYEYEGQLSTLKRHMEEYEKQIHDYEVLAQDRETQLCSGRLLADEYRQELERRYQVMEEQRKDVLCSNQKLEEQKRHLNIIQEHIAQAETKVASLEYWLQVAAKSEPMKLAHFMVQLKHALMGTREERKECWRWLCGDRSFVPKYSYLRQSIVQASELRAQVNAARDAAENAGYISPLEIASYGVDTAGTADSTSLAAGLKELAQIVDRYPGKTVIVLPELVDWNIPLFQRPQQLAMSFADMGILFVYFTPNGNDDVHSVKKLMDNLILLPPEWFDQVITLLTQRNLDVILDIWSTDNKHFMPWIERYMDMGCRILYEYIDEISDDITGKVPLGTYERHHALLEDKDIAVVATADKLYDDVIKIRGCEVNCLNSGNGVDLKHFRIKTDHSKIPMSLRRLVRSKKPIIGYFGAIANWFDFEMVAYAARQRPEYEFMMIGPNYGSHDLSCLDELKELKNLHFVGTIEYQKLPHVANRFTVATIPFLLNEITESTSPIKLFEYMAMGKPVVTTAMRECFKYPVVRIARDKEDFVVALDEAVKNAGDEQFLKEIAEVAERNSWLEKAEELCRLLDIVD